MSIRRITNEHLLYLLALALAAFLRFYRLGVAPLSDFEAGWALQALELAGRTIPGLDLPLGPQPAYGLLTGALFGLFGSTGFLARFLPALAGTVLVLAPVFFRRRLGRPAALVLAFGLALDPTLTAVSRLAGGPLPAVGFGLLAMALWASRRPVLAGLAGGLALLSGPMVFNGAISLGLAGLALAVLGGFRVDPQAVSPLRASPGGTTKNTKGTKKDELAGGSEAGADDGGQSSLAMTETEDLSLRGGRQPDEYSSLRGGRQPDSGSDPQAISDSINKDEMAGGSEAGADDGGHRPLAMTEGEQPEGTRLRRALYSLGAAVLLVGTLFFWAPQGLAALADGLVAYLNGWLEPSNVSGVKILASLAFYGLLPLAFGLASAMRIGWIERSPAPRTRSFLLLWAAAALLVALLYPARQVSDLSWALVPLWALAALELARHLPRTGISPLAAAQAVLVVVLLGLFWLTLAGLARSLPGAPGAGLRLGIMAGILALILLTSLLIALGWDWDTGRQGLAWGLALGLGLWSLSALWGAAQLRQNSPLELLTPPPGPGQEKLLLETIQDLSSWNTGFTDRIEIQTNVSSPALLWALRGFPNLKVSQGTIQAGQDPQVLPPVLITSQLEPAPALSGSYSGQDFTWWVYPGWAGPLPDRLSSWIVSREAPLTTEKIILWARSDLFPGSAP